MRLNSKNQDMNPSPLAWCYGMEPVGTGTPVRMSLTVPGSDLGRLRRGVTSAVDAIITVLLATESQSGRVAGKEASWAYYVAYLQAKFRMSVLLLVVCQEGPVQDPSRREMESDHVVRQLLPRPGDGS